jgi:sec-independent protein translocase protein TatC
MSKKNTKEMSFLDHLEELRWLLVRSSIAIMVFACISFYFSGEIFDKILFAPKNPNFITYRFFCSAATYFGMDQSMCVTEIPFQIQSRTMSGQFNADMWTSLTVGLILAFPFVLWEFWKFIKPALHEKERKNASGFVTIASILFFLGILFGYFVITPLSINFLGNYKVSKEVVNSFDLSSYIDLISSTTFSCGLVFELPIVMFFLSKVGLVTPQFLRKYRKISLVIILIIAAIVTPPDIVSQVIVTIPLMMLYEASILISAWVLKKEKNEQLSKRV